MRQSVNAREAKRSNKLVELSQIEDVVHGPSQGDVQHTVGVDKRIVWKTSRAMAASFLEYDGKLVFALTFFSVHIGPCCMDPNTNSFIST